MSARRAIDYGLQLRADRQHQFGHGLLLLDVQFVAVWPDADVLWPNADSIAAALNRVEQQRERQSGRAADWIVCLELSYLFRRPRMMTFPLVLPELDITRRIIFAETLGHCKVEQRANYLQPIACRDRLFKERKPLPD